MCGGCEDDLNEELSPTTHTHTAACSCGVYDMSGLSAHVPVAFYTSSYLLYISWSTKVGTQRRDIFDPPPLKLFLRKGSV